MRLHVHLRNGKRDSNVYAKWAVIYLRGIQKLQSYMKMGTTGSYNAKQIK